MKKTMMIVLMLSVAVLLISGISCTEDRSSSVKSPVADSPEVREGAEIYVKTCQSCHGEGGRGDIGPDLTDNKWKYGGSDDDLYTSISEGRPGGMPGWKNSLGEEKIKKVISYMRSISK
jgi:cytochrome c oxidase cbb3-type subunit 3